MIGSPLRPTSPEKTTRRISLPSVHSSAIEADPRMCPASVKLARTPGTTSKAVS
jgi:hypothetical protein